MLWNKSTKGDDSTRNSAAAAPLTVPADHFSTVRELLRRSYPDGWWETKLCRCLALDFCPWDLYDYWVEQVYHDSANPRPKLLAELVRLRKISARPALNPTWTR